MQFPEDANQLISVIMFRNFWGIMHMEAYMTKDKAHVLIETAMGRMDADLAIRNAMVVDVYSRTSFKADVYIKDGIIIGFDGERKAREEYDAEGRYLIPGLIDAHCHIESSHLSPAQFSDTVVPFGTTTVIADPHEICNVCGLDGMEYMLKASEGIPLSVFLMFPSCVPATPFEHAGAVLEALGSSSYTHLTPKVYEESFQHRFLQTPENAEMLDLIHDSIVYDSGRLFADDIAMFNLFRNAYYDTEWRTLYGERYTIWMANIERVTVKLG